MSRVECRSSSGGRPESLITRTWSLTPVRRVWNYLCLEFHKPLVLPYLTIAPCRSSWLIWTDDEGPTPHGTLSPLPPTSHGRRLDTFGYYRRKLNENLPSLLPLNLLLGNLSPLICLERRVGGDEIPGRSRERLFSVLERRPIVGSNFICPTRPKTTDGTHCETSSHGS